MKLMLIVERENLDIICTQETWMAAGAESPVIPGYRVVERRRMQGTHGGLATYVRQSIGVEMTEGNEYGIYTKIVLPTSQRLNVVNVYIPPYVSLHRKGIQEKEATS
jgi:exonuclease III